MVSGIFFGSINCIFHRYESDTGIFSFMVPKMNNSKNVIFNAYYNMLSDLFGGGKKFTGAPDKSFGTFFRVG